ncbi:MAG: DUF4325 domain-containing protein [Methanobrevibacter sp.]|jgi:23S rRNA pseudoU1915 N3-methylase RlmH|nr:DUF4325 domain-containing protein [Methanobrevibacter sp.]
MNMTIQHIKLEKEISRKLIIRQSARSLFEKIRNENLNNVILDFTGVDFISRSFAQEYIYQRGDKNFEVIEENMIPFIENMLNVVEKDYIALKTP